MEELNGLNGKAFIQRCKRIKNKSGQDSLITILTAFIRNTGKTLEDLKLSNEDICNASLVFEWMMARACVICKVEYNPIEIERRYIEFRHRTWHPKFLDFK